MRDKAKVKDHDTKKDTMADAKDVKDVQDVKCYRIRLQLRNSDNGRMIDRTAEISVLSYVELTNAVRLVYSAELETSSCDVSGFVYSDGVVGLKTVVDNASLRQMIDKCEQARLKPRLLVIAVVVENGSLLNDYIMEEKWKEASDMVESGVAIDGTDKHTGGNTLQLALAAGADSLVPLIVKKHGTSILCSKTGDKSIFEWADMGRLYTSATFVEWLSTTIEENVTILRPLWQMSAWYKTETGRAVAKQLGFRGDQSFIASGNKVVALHAFEYAVGDRLLIVDCNGKLRVGTVKVTIGSRVQVEYLDTSGFEWIDSYETNRFLLNLNMNGLLSLRLESGQIVKAKIVEHPDARVIRVQYSRDTDLCTTECISVTSKRLAPHQNAYNYYPHATVHHIDHDRYSLTNTIDGKSFSSLGALVYIFPPFEQEKQIEPPISTKPISTKPISTTPISIDHNSAINVEQVVITFLVCMLLVLLGWLGYQYYILSAAPIARCLVMTERCRSGWVDYYSTVEMEQRTLYGADHNGYGYHFTPLLDANRCHYAANLLHSWCKNHRTDLVVATWNYTLVSIIPSSMARNIRWKDQLTSVGMEENRAIITAAAMHTADHELTETIDAFFTEFGIAPSMSDKLFDRLHKDDPWPVGDREDTIVVANRVSNLHRWFDIYPQRSITNPLSIEAIPRSVNLDDCATICLQTPKCQAIVVETEKQNDTTKCWLKSFDSLRHSLKPEQTWPITFLSAIRKH
jgi:hypothetical protein